MRVERIAHTRPACRTKIWLQALHRMNSAFTLDPIISASAWGQLSRPGWRSNVMAHMVGCHFRDQLMLGHFAAVDEVGQQ